MLKNLCKLSYLFVYSDAMFRNLEKWYYPTTIEEALSLLKRGEIVPHAGGTGLLRVKSNRIRAMVDLRQVPINYLTEDDQFYHIGAGVKLAQIASWEKLTGAAKILQQAASQAASTALRNRITIGGSIAQPPPWSDFPPVLLALDAQIEIAGSTAGIYSADEYFKKIPLDGTSLLTNIRIPKLTGKAAFERVTQTKFDYSMLDLAVYGLLQNKKIDCIRIAFGCAVPRAIRLFDVEQKILNQQPSEALFAEATRIVDFNPTPDRRASKEFRRELSKILLNRKLKELFL